MSWSDKPSLLRGHSLLPPIDVLRAIPLLYGTEDIPLADKTVHFRLFTATGAEWLIFEWDRADLFFAWCSLGDPTSAEAGYVSLEEMRDLLVKTPNGPIIVERDLSFVPSRFGDLTH